MAKSDRKTIDTVFVLLGVVATVVLLVVGIISFVAYRFADTSVKTELSAQQIYFPAKDSTAIKALPASDQAAMVKYAGQQLTTGAQARAYADNFIAYHLTKIANGETYSQVSAQATANPTNAALKAKQQTLFQGETLRGMLLGDGYAYWMFGQIALFASFTALAGAAIMAVLVLLGLQHMKKLR